MRRKERYLFYERKRRSRWWLVYYCLFCWCRAFRCTSTPLPTQPPKENIKLTVPTLPMNLEGVKFLHIATCMASFWRQPRAYHGQTGGRQLQGRTVNGRHDWQGWRRCGFLRLISRFPRTCPCFYRWRRGPPVFDTERGTYSSWILKARDLGAVFWTRPIA